MDLTDDDMYSYAYDTENRLVSVTSAVETNGTIRVLNAYDHRHRRIRKIVQRLAVSVSQPPAPPIETREWKMVATHTYVWDGNLPVHETVQRSNGSTVERSYYWGMDKSGTEEGAGGVGGLLAVSVDGTFYIPCYDHNGDIVLYVSEDGSVAAQYAYDPYGNVVEASGPLADEFPFGFSTKYHDREPGLVYYLMRFYNPPHGRWLNRDPIEEAGGENLFCFVMNNPITRFDTDGCFVLPVLLNPCIPPPEPSPDIIDQFGFAPLPNGEEKWFERNYAGWPAEARRRFTLEIERSIDCKTTSFTGPSGRINIEPSRDRGGSTSTRTPGENEQDYGDAGQSDWSADKVLGSFSIGGRTK